MTFIEEYDQVGTSLKQLQSPKTRYVYHNSINLDDLLLEWGVDTVRQWLNQAN